MATIDECIEFALKNIGLWWRYGISRHCDEWKYIIIGRIFESEIILIPPSLKISESSSNGSYRNTDEVWWRYGFSRSSDEWLYPAILYPELSFLLCYTPAEESYSVADTKTARSLACFIYVYDGYSWYMVGHDSRTFRAWTVCWVQCLWRRTALPNLTRKKSYYKIKCWYKFIYESLLL
jgi:hypothetical protein